MTVTPFLMFEGRAEEAMSLYASLFPGAGITSLILYGPDGPGKEGSVLQGVLELDGRPYRFFDSPSPHAFSFTPSFSFFVNLDNAEDFHRIQEELAKDGNLLMPVGEYGFAELFCWLQDRFGVSWQLALNEAG